jgi:hypothetical protein
VNPSETSPKPCPNRGKKRSKKMTDKEQKKEKRRKRNVPVTIRMTPEEKIQFDKKVLKSGLSQTEFFIKTALKKEIKIVGSKEQLEKLIFEINKIGVNLNQIARRINEGIFYGAEKELEQLKEKYSESLDVMIQLLGEVKK